MRFPVQVDGRASSVGSFKESTSDQFCRPSRSEDECSSSTLDLLEDRFPSRSRTRSYPTTLRNSCCR